MSHRSLLAGLMTRVGALFDRYPLNSPWVREAVQTKGLALWFALLVVPLLAGFLARRPVLFFDARLYLEATRMFLHGGDPWSVSLAGFYFAAPPPTLLPLVLFALLPDPWAWVVLGSLCVGGAVATLRILDLPWWWLLFPPVVHGIVSGNVQLLLLPLMLRGFGWAAALLKVYAVVPEAILGHWRQLLVIAGILVVTSPWLPWATYVARYGEINDALSEQSNFGPSMAVSLLFALPALGAMWAIGRDRSAWLAVPALWPAQQWYYATLALPARSQVAAFVIALPFRESGLAALMVLAIVSLVRRKRGDRVPVDGERGSA